MKNICTLRDREGLELLALFSNFPRWDEVANVPLNKTQQANTSADAAHVCNNSSLVWIPHPVCRLGSDTSKTDKVFCSCGRNPVNF